MRRLRFGWDAPWDVMRPWRPTGWLGTDQWHNPAVSIVVPPLGAFHVWFGDWRDNTDGHFRLNDTRAWCPECAWIWNADDSDMTWRQGIRKWWSPLRPTSPPTGG